MDIATQTVARQASPAPAPASAPSKISSDFDTFLKLLTAQIRNQDPLEPADATAYTAQLATFSNVEQAVKTNTLLGRMTEQMVGQEVAGAAGYIGMDARHSGAVGHVGDQTTLFTTISAAADRAELVVTDPVGREVARHPVDPDATAIGWPASGQGGTIPDGLYDIRIESWAGEQPLDPTPVAHYARVDEVTLGSAGAELVLRGGARLPVSAIASLRAPGA